MTRPKRLKAAKVIAVETPGFPHPAGCCSQEGHIRLTDFGLSKDSLLCLEIGGDFVSLERDSKELWHLSK